MLRVSSLVKDACKRLAQTKHLAVSFARPYGDVSLSEKSEEKSSRWRRFWSPEASIANPGFKNRWLLMPPALLCSTCFGAPYAWSVISEPLSRSLGLVCQSASDWSIVQTTIPMSLLFCTHGITAAIVGKWQMRVGCRTAVSLGAVCFGSGMSLAGAGAYLHSLPMIYLGFGVLCGIGNGLSYTPPLQAMLEWFPDRKGLASGILIMGFGAGAFVLTPIASQLMKVFSKAPQFLGQNIETITQNGKFYATTENGLIEVVNANATDLSRIPHALSEGYYVVGSGSTGVAATLTTIGLVYSAIIFSSALVIKRPHPSYQIANPINLQTTATITKVPDMHIDDVMKTSQFWLLISSMSCMAVGGMGLFAAAKPLMTEIFGIALPDIVTYAFASSYIMMLSIGNLSGRIAWAAVSDKLGRRNTFHLLTTGSIAIYSFLPSIINAAIEYNSVLALATFCGGSAVAISLMGGGFSILPAYEADLFGVKYVGAIHGRMLMSGAIGALTGPPVFMYLRGLSESSAIAALIKIVPPDAFKAKFGVDVSSYSDLIASKTLTISKLMEIMPAGTMDPTPFIYHTPIYTLAGFMTLAALSHYMVKPVQHAQKKD